MMESSKIEEDPEDTMESSELADEDILTFGKSNLNSVLLENLLTRFKKFTPVQQKAIPIILSGRDVMIKSQTGSGKTLAALIPLLNSLIDKSGSFSPFDLKLLILVPSNDLINQVTDLLKILLRKCSDRLSVKPLTELSNSLSNIVIAKPSIAVELLNSQQLLYLIIDEADLLFEFGYKNDMLKLIEILRNSSKFKSFQSVLLSATLDPEIKNIANLLLFKPVYIDVPYTPKLGNVKQYYVLVNEDVKLLNLYVLLKMECIPYGSIIFVNTNKTGYYLYCFLRKLCLDINIISKLLSPKLRHTILQSFNQGLLGSLILIDDDSEDEFSLSRGIDFKNVNCVINFDQPKSLGIYKHRIGRTGRNYQSGSSLTFFTNESDQLLQQLVFSGTVSKDSQLKEVTGSENNEELNGVNEETLDSEIQEIKIGEEMFESFNYRINDVLKMITPKLVEIAQIQSVRHSAIEQEEFLKNVDENDMLLLKSVLKNDNQLLKPEKKHLTFIPSYLINNQLQSTIDTVKQHIYPHSHSNKVNKLKRSKFKKTEQTREKVHKRKRKFFRKKLPHFKRKKK
uniref:ATP-dependent RNA helicase n=1 Tax=Theileria annulata TaxID=5874 RepID=A0A3B0NG74_THEAN